jgi:glycosyltransferase involved in cell wall biosynthesis
MKKRILILAYTDLSKDPRPLKQIKLLRDDYEVYSVGAVPNGAEKMFYNLPKPHFISRIFRLVFLKLGFKNYYYWDKNKKELVSKLQGIKFDLIIVHEIILAPLAFKIKQNTTKMLLDAHEYTPKQYEDDFFWKFFLQKYLINLLQKYLSKFDYILTVGEFIAREYEKKFRVKVNVITNAADFYELKPKNLKEEDKIQIIHHGVAAPNRNLELLLNLANILDDRFQVNLMLVVPSSSVLYYRKLQKRANKKVKFLSPVPYSEIITTLSKFDIGIIFYPFTGFNIQYSLPNKFFEFIQARIMLAIGPSPEMESLVEKYSLGIVSETFCVHDIAEKIMNLKQHDINNYKKNVDNVAYKLSSEVNKLKLKEIIKNLLD